jgi:hypothetical protein
MKIPGFIVTENAVNNENPLMESILSVSTFPANLNPDKYTIQ